MAVATPSIIENTDTISEVKKKPAPQYKVLLHNDDFVAAELVVIKLQEISQLSETQAIAVMMQAHRSGVGLIKICDMELAEHYCDAFGREGITVTMEPTEE